MKTKFEEFLNEGLISIILTSGAILYLLHFINM